MLIGLAAKNSHPQGGGGRILRLNLSSGCIAQPPKRLGRS